MPRLRRKGHTLVDRNTPEAWRQYYLKETRARRLTRIVDIVKNGKKWAP